MTNIAYDLRSMYAFKLHMQKYAAVWLSGNYRHWSHDRSQGRIHRGAIGGSESGRVGRNTTRPKFGLFQFLPHPKTKLIQLKYVE